MRAHTYTYTCPYADTPPSGVQLHARNLTILTRVSGSLVLASKMYDDDFYQNKYYAQVGGLGVQEFNELEVQFLFLLDFKLSVDPDTYEKYSSELSKHARKSSGMSLSLLIIE